MEITEENIIKIAPDEGTLERAKGLAKSYLWKEVAAKDNVLWGFYASAEHQVYESKIVVGELRNHCSCPSRKQPCKHVLALLLLYAQDTDFEEKETYPSSVRQWLAGLKEDAEQSEKSKEASTKTRDKRLSLMATGMAELEIWLTDMMQSGLAVLESNHANYWEEVSAKMTDAKLGGIGRRLRSFPSFFGKAQWQEQLLIALSDLYLLHQGFNKLEDLPQDLQSDVLSFCGLSLKKAEVFSRGETTLDRWLAMGQIRETEDKLMVRKTWFLGEKSQKKGLILEYMPTHMRFETDWTVGAVYQAEAVFYPSAYPSRMLFKDFSYSNEPFSQFIGYENFEHFLHQYALALGKNPWLRTFPALLEEVTPVFHKNELLLIDQNRQKIVSHQSDDKGWKLLALSGGHSICVFGEWAKDRFYPMSALADNRLVVL